MRKIISLTSVALLCLLLAFVFPFKKFSHFVFEHEHEGYERGDRDHDRDREEFEGKDEDEDEEKESGISGQMSSWFLSRAYPDPYNLNEKYLNGWHQAEAIRNRQASKGNGIQSGTWNSIGPNTGIGGRFLTIAIDKNNSNKLFAGSAGGGIWKSTNAGTSWTAVSTGYPVMGVSSIIIDPSNSNNIYAGTGEVYRLDSTGTTPLPGNTGFSVWKTRGTYGVGILKSSDGGATWDQVMNKQESDLFAIQTLKFDPANSNNIYACATDGLWRSTDAGGSWTKIFSVTYVSDVVVSGSTIVAAIGNFGNAIHGIYRSTNGGSTWTKITSGLPAGFQGFSKFDCVTGDPNTIVASIGVSETATVELYRSTDFGLTWTGLTGSNHTDWQYWCAHDVAINPGTTTKMIFAGVNMYSYTLPSTKASVGSTVHDDVHDIKFDPNSSTIVYVCCDGGIYKSTNSGSTYSAINSGLNATQFYASLGVSATDANFCVGGLQDNGQVVYNGTTWTTVSGVGGDGTSCAVDPSNDNNMVVSRDARGIYKSTNRGSSGTNIATYWGSTFDSRTAFCAPVAYSKSDPTIVYAASDNLHKSTSLGTFSNNAGSSAASYIDLKNKPAIALAVSPTNSSKIYVSVSNFAQHDNDDDGIYVTGLPNVLKTTTGNIPFTSIMGSGGTALPNRFIMDFAINATNDNKVYAAIGGFGTAHIYYTADGGATWTAKGAGLPDVPFNAVLIDPVTPTTIYAGGDMGVYVSSDAGTTWFDYNNGLPLGAEVMDIQPAADNSLFVATHGRGVFKGPRFTPSLPVDLISFTGDMLAASNKLDWEVGPEVGVSHYELERGTDGYNFQNITTIPATGATDYTYNDPVSNSQTYYYKLKIVDVSGTYKYSNVVMLRRIGKNTVEIFGNPFLDAFKIKFTLVQKQKVQINLYDAEGKLLRSEEPLIPAGAFLYGVDNLSSLPKGTYFVEAILNNQRWKQKVLKK